MSTIDHKANYVWVRTPSRIRCAYMLCQAEPSPAEIAESRQSRHSDGR